MLSLLMVTRADGAWSISTSSGWDNNPGPTVEGGEKAPLHPGGGVWGFLETKHLENAYQPHKPKHVFQPRHGKHVKRSALGKRGCVKKGEKMEGLGSVSCN